MPTEPAKPARQGWIPLCVPEIRGNEWAYVKECLDTNFVSSVGPFVERFERQMAGQVGSRFAVATVNGTAALHVALLVAGVEPDDEVLVSTLTFIAPANAIRYVGAWPVFVDAEPTYWQMDPQKVVDWLEQSCRWDGDVLRNRTTGRRVSAIVPVHILGHPVEMERIVEAARKYELVVVEDATESLGVKYQGQTAGTIGDIGCFSFNGNKLITTGGGGMIVTDREDLAAKARYLTTQAKNDPIEFVHCEIGFNYRLSNVQAAIGCAQLEHLGEYIEKKLSIARQYAEGLANRDGITLMREAPWATSAFWLYTILVDADRLGLDSRALMRYLERHQVQTRPLWQPIHQSPAHRGMPATDCSVAESLNRSALSLPCSVGLTRDDQECVIDLIRRAIDGQ
jgi:perosamine synthetase